MIRLDEIHIEEFRGIRKLDLTLQGGNFGICGPNGTGKSGVVDAIEFCLTGNITRLSGQGQGNLSVKGHGPHVDYRNEPERAKVAIKATIPSLNKQVTITRSVKTPSKVKIDPPDNAAARVIEELQSHPEFALSRREIAKYIITPPSQRSTDVQTLLRLDYIGELRKALNSLKNKCKSDYDEAKRAQARAEEELKTALGVTTLDREEVLEIANAQRAALGLAMLTELNAKTSFNEGAAEEGEGAKKDTIAKNIALLDIQKILAAINAYENEDIKENRESALETLKKLKDDQNALSLARAHGFIATGLDLVIKDACPLCDLPWEAEALRAHLKAKLLGGEEIQKLLTDFSTAAAAVGGAIEDRIADVHKAANYATKLDPVVSNAEMIEYVTIMEGVKQALVAFDNDPSEVDRAIAALENPIWNLPNDVQTRLDEIEKGVNALPDNSAKDGAIKFLAVLQDRYERLLAATKKARPC
jgi:DNA repair exonuclease SbcCD ATPase subunit